MEISAIWFNLLFFLTLHFTIEINAITELESFSFQNFRWSIFILRHNELKTMSAFIFYHTNGSPIKYIDVSHNKIDHMDKDCLMSVEKLKELDVSHNRLKIIHHDLLKYANLLEVLDLTHNFIFKFEANLGHLGALRVLNLHNNTYISLIERRFRRFLAVDKTRPDRLFSIDSQCNKVICWTLKRKIQANLHIHFAEVCNDTRITMACFMHKCKVNSRQKLIEYCHANAEEVGLFCSATEKVKYVNKTKYQRPCYAKYSVFEYVSNRTKLIVPDLTVKINPNEKQCTWNNECNSMVNNTVCLKGYCMCDYGDVFNYNERSCINASIQIKFLCGLPLIVLLFIFFLKAINQCIRYVYDMTDIEEICPACEQRMKKPPNNIDPALLNEILDRNVKKMEIEYKGYSGNRRSVKLLDDIYSVTSEYVNQCQSEKMNNTQILNESIASSKMVQSNLKNDTFTIRSMQSMAPSNKMIEDIKLNDAPLIIKKRLSTDILPDIVTTDIDPEPAINLKDMMEQLPNAVEEDNIPLPPEINIMVRKRNSTLVPNYSDALKGVKDN